MYVSVSRVDKIIMLSIWLFDSRTILRQTLTHTLTRTLTNILSHTRSLTVTVTLTYTLISFCRKSRYSALSNYNNYYYIDICVGVHVGYHPYTFLFSSQQVLLLIQNSYSYTFYGFYGFYAVELYSIVIVSYFWCHTNVPHCRYYCTSTGWWKCAHN